MVRAARAVALVALGALGLAPAAAQETAGAATFPSRAIHIVVPFPAGGPADIAARLIGQKMSEDWGSPVVVDNRPGANTIIGAQVAARAAPDGYTLLMVINSTLTMNQYLYRTLPYDPLADFAPITPTVKSMSLLAVPAATGPRTVQGADRRAPRPRPASSTTAPAPSRRSSWAPCSTRRPGSTSCMCRSRARPRPCKAC